MSGNHSSSGRSAAGQFDDPGRQFTALVRPHLDVMYRMAYRWTRRREDAEDLVQDVVVKLVDRVDEMAQVDKLRPWLIRILYRRFVDTYRRQQRSPVESSDYLPPDDARIDAASEDSLYRLEWQQVLQRGLDVLDDDQRDTILLHDVEGYTAEEIAGILDIRVGTVKSRVHRARARLRELLERELSDPLERVWKQREK